MCKRINYLSVNKILQFQHVLKPLNPNNVLKLEKPSWLVAAAAAEAVAARDSSSGRESNSGSSSSIVVAAETAGTAAEAADTTAGGVATGISAAAVAVATAAETVATVVALYSVFSREGLSHTSLKWTVANFSFNIIQFRTRSNKLEYKYIWVFI